MALTSSCVFNQRTAKDCQLQNRWGENLLQFSSRNYIIKNGYKFNNSIQYCENTKIIKKRSTWRNIEIAAVRLTYSLRNVVIQCLWVSLAGNFLIDFIQKKSIQIFRYAIDHRFYGKPRSLEVVCILSCEIKEIKKFMFFKRIEKWQNQTYTLREIWYND